MRRVTESMYQPSRVAKSPPPSPLTSRPCDVPRVSFAPAGSAGGPPFPGTALSIFGRLSSKTFDLFVGGSGLSFLNSGIFSALVGGSGGFGFSSGLFKVLVGSTTLLSVTVFSLGNGIPALPTKFTFTFSPPPPAPAHWLPCQWKYEASTRKISSAACKIPETFMYGLNGRSSEWLTNELAATVDIRITECDCDRSAARSQC